MRTLVLIRYLLEIEVEQRHGARVATCCLNGPLVWHEVILMEKLGAFSWLRYQPLRLIDMTDDYVAYICVELFPGHLQILIILKSLLPFLSQSVNFFSSHIHEYQAACFLVKFNLLSFY